MTTRPSGLTSNHALMIRLQIPGSGNVPSLPAQALPGGQLWVYCIPRPQPLTIPEHVAEECERNRWVERVSAKG